MPQDFPLQAFIAMTLYRNYCVACTVTVVIFWQLNLSFYLNDMGKLNFEFGLKSLSFRLGAEIRQMAKCGGEMLLFRGAMW